MGIYISRALLDFGFPWWLSSKESACRAGDTGSIPGSGRSSGEGNGNLLQCSYLENCEDGGIWWATVHEVTKSWTRLRMPSHATHTVYMCVCMCICMYITYIYTYNFKSLICYPLRKMKVELLGEYWA